MIRILTPFIYKKVNRISPSQLYGVLKCPFKMVLAEAYHHKPLVALSPNAYFGSVLHTIIELITNRTIVDLPTFEHYWKELIMKKDNELINEGLDELVPIKAHIKNVGLKKIQLQWLINNKSTYSRPSAGYSNRYRSEMSLFDNTGRIFGKADLVYEGIDYIEIYDFKTGNILKQIFNEGSDITYLIKEEYEYQLKLYAYLYFQMKGRSPDKLSLISLDKKKIEIPFDIGECESLYHKAINILEELNSHSQNGNFKKLAHCAEDNCKFCVYRPACVHYTDWMENNKLVTNDICGTLLSFKVFPNGNTCAYISEGFNTRVISGFNQKHEGSFNSRLNKKLVFFNIQKDKNSTNLIATNTTTVYEY
ncbi:PD-(D/E)XK nuclease family protein [Chitinophaga sp. sic0106]|uniref:PD-(D/E)XK nuclease family protein n=1 Tax=Chitinophaga sp. sic0106 TaxID=2854785 RepID=UPI001C457E89|nr:PD-(D/E)XK nuclease family protein [Chitinophaga sp. sic0106]MBV7530466.1 PD-(D/E)XK nuclease family protein [Chitinophaga sp. sic0106]